MDFGAIDGSKTNFFLVLYIYIDLIQGLQIVLRVIKHSKLSVAASFENFREGGGGGSAN